MGVKLKKFDLLIRENSKVSQDKVLKYLNRVFNKIEENNTDDDKTFGYATVFDARTSEYYLYYSNKAKDFFKMTKNRYDLIPKDIITERNFLNTLLKYMNIIKNSVVSPIKLVTKKLKVQKDGTIKLPSQISGDIVMNTVEVVKDGYYESFVVTLENGNTLVGVPPEEAGKEVVLSYLSKE